MAKGRDFIRKWIPSWLLEGYRNKKRQQVRKQLEAQKHAGNGHSKSTILQQLKAIGIVEGDSLLVHSSLSKIGYLENGPQDLVDALLEAIGPSGNLLMPNSPNPSFQLDYIQQLAIFDVKNDASKLGAITEYFRKLPNAVRSQHPTEPVSCIGPDAAYFTATHFGNETPYNENSPFYKISARKGKILYIGVTLGNAGTNLHTLEDAVENFKFPVYHDMLFPVRVRFENGTVHEMRTRVHNPIWSKKRKCDELIPRFVESGVARRATIGNAPTLVFDAEKMLHQMIDDYKTKGITMYTPHGS